MKVIVTDNFEDSCRIAEQIATVIRHKPDARLVLRHRQHRTGRLSISVAANRAGELDFSRVSTINLDECWVGLLIIRRATAGLWTSTCRPDQHRQGEHRSCQGGTGDIEANVKSFREASQRDPPTQLLGIGVDGHGFQRAGRGAL
ncbi:MAG: hypothetical protein R2912_09510 [Eubacteriales bacterium]